MILPEHELLDSSLSGVWVTMVTPFTDSGEIDYPGVDALVDWYLGHQVDGLFAVCLSSESFALTPDERLALARRIVRRVDRRIPVIAGGTYDPNPANHPAEVAAMSRTGVDAVVFLTTAMAASDEYRLRWRDRVASLLEQVPDTVRLGLYESPQPHRVIMPLEDLLFCRDTGRFCFLKDTSCDLEVIRDRLSSLGSSSLRLFNANTETLLASLNLGAAGYSSIMANVAPDLYRWLIGHHLTDPESATRLSSFLSVADAAVVSRCYPASAKYYLSLDGVPISWHTRVETKLPVDQRTFRVMDALATMIDEYRARYRVASDG